MIHLSSLDTRDHLPQFLLGHGLKSQGVEIGTHRGDFALTILQRWPGHLHCVDPWTANYDPTDPASCGDRLKDYRRAQQNLRDYTKRSTVHRKTSAEAVNSFEDNALDFVYVDGCHQPEFVQQDLDLWWPKIHEGGFLFGHDIICPGEYLGGWGRFVQPVVFAFCAKHDRDVHFIMEPDGRPWSYHINK